MVGKRKLEEMELLFVPLFVVSSGFAGEIGKHFQSHPTKFTSVKGHPVRANSLCFYCSCTF